MKNISLLLVLILSFYLKSSAQKEDQLIIEYDDIKRNNIYVEAYAVAPDYISSYLSVNYEYFMGNRRKKSLRIGFYPNFEDKGFVFPLTFNWITAADKKHHFEYGVGPVLGFEIDTQNSKTYFVFGGLMVPLMYRYQKKKGFIFRIGANLFVSYPTIISPSVSFGYKF